MKYDNVHKTIEVFKNGGIVVFPTDTAVGIGCRMDNEASVRRIFEIKQRSFDNALLVLVDSEEMAEQYVAIPEEVKTKLIDIYWPGGLSIFFKTKLGKVSGLVTGNTDILAVRWPKHAELQNIITAVGVPIIATSANISGGITPYTIQDVNRQVLKKADYVMEGECTYKKESTIIDTTVTPWKKIREGAIKISI
ncbi:MAG: L-threonylcarbamoyladenylate synthase [Candidatus Levyibacteriota bacterium]